MFVMSNPPGTCSRRTSYKIFLKWKHLDLSNHVWWPRWKPRWSHAMINNFYWRNNTKVRKLLDEQAIEWAIKEAAGEEEEEISSSSTSSSAGSSSIPASSSNIRSGSISSGCKRKRISNFTSSGSSSSSSGSINSSSSSSSSPPHNIGAESNLVDEVGCKGWNLEGKCSHSNVRCINMMDQCDDADDHGDDKLETKETDLTILGQQCSKRRRMESCAQGTTELQPNFFQDLGLPAPGQLFLQLEIKYKHHNDTMEITLICNIQSKVDAFKLELKNLKLEYMQITVTKLTVSTEKTISLGSVAAKMATSAITSAVVTAKFSIVATVTVGVTSVTMLTSWISNLFTSIVIVVALAGTMTTLYNISIKYETYIFEDFIGGPAGHTLL